MMHTTLTATIRTRWVLSIALVCWWMVITPADHAYPSVRAQFEEHLVFLPYAGASASRGIQIDLRRHGGNVWGMAQIGSFLYIGQGAELTRYRFDERSIPDRELVYRAEYVPTALHAFEDRLLLAGPSQATLVSVAGTGPPGVVWSLGELEGAPQETIEILADDRACRVGARSILVCERHDTGLKAFDLSGPTIETVEAPMLIGPFEEGGWRADWSGDGRVVIGLGSNDNTGSGVGILVIDTRDPASIRTEAIIVEGDSTAHRPVRIRGRWLFASEHRFGDTGSGVRHGLVVYELGSEGEAGARRTAEIDLDEIAIRSMELYDDRLFAHGVSPCRYCEVPDELLVFDVASPERPRLISRTPACGSDAREGRIAGWTESRVAVVCVNDRVAETEVVIFDIGSEPPTVLARVPFVSSEPFAHDAEIEHHY